MQSIAAWLQNGTYEEGVRLYEQHGSNSFLKQKFKAGPNDYNTPKLREELAKLAPLVPVAGAESESSKITSHPAPHTDTSVPKPNPDHAYKYLQLTKRKQRLYIELNMLMEQKHHLPEGEELRLCCVSILRLHQQITEAWALIDHYQEHQSFPEDEKKEKPQLDPKKEMQLLRQTISKAKKRLESASCRDKVQTETLLAISRNKLAQLVALHKKSRHE